MHRHEAVRAFTTQAASFNGAAVTRLPETLDALIELAGPSREERWLDAACGPGVVSRALAPRVSEAVGVDATPAMVELGQRKMARAGIVNARFVDWLARGPGSQSNEDQIRWMFGERPEQSACLRRSGEMLMLQVWMGRWRR